MPGYTYQGSQRGLTAEEAAEDAAAELTAALQPDTEARRRVLEGPGGWICPVCERGYRSDRHRRDCMGQYI